MQLTIPALSPIKHTHNAPQGCSMHAKDPQEEVICAFSSTGKVAVGVRMCEQQPTQEPSAIRWCAWSSGASTCSHDDHRCLHRYVSIPGALALMLHAGKRTRERISSVRTTACVSHFGDCMPGSIRVVALHSTYWQSCRPQDLVATR
jgi:hypothetical protein